MGHDDKKATRLKIAGGTMRDVLENQYFRDSVEMADRRDIDFQNHLRNSKFDAKKFLVNRA